MNPQSAVEPRAGHATGADIRTQLLARIPCAERRLTLAGISTALLEGGHGRPVVLLHGPGESAAHWMRVIPGLVQTHRVVAPDLPGHGNSDPGDTRLDMDRMLAWLGELIDQTCETPPAMVAQLLGGAIALRFALRHPGRLDRLVLEDTFGLRPFQPTPEFEQALLAFLARPAESTYEGLWRRCAFDLDTLREGLGDDWALYKAYNLDRADSPSLGAAQRTLMEQFAMPAIPPDDLARIGVPVTLIWGRHDLATPLEVAQNASARYGWALHVIEKAADGPSMEQPEAYLSAVRTALES
jgi:pimeloyl-ACP methyl ester carboxylesterase